MTWGKGWGNNSESGNEIYQTLLEQEVSRTLAQKKGLGIGELIYKQITNQQKNKSNLSLSPLPSGESPLPSPLLSGESPSPSPLPIGERQGEGELK
ncbi:MAG: rod-binding protein [Thermodesulfobacteriota bacterium]